MAEMNQQISTTALFLVDDHPLIRRALSESLYTVFPALEVHAYSTAEEALNALKRITQNPSFELILVLMDFDLPGMMGIEAIESAMAVDDRVKVVTVSGKDDETQVAACFEVGVAGFMSKGAPIDEMMSALRRLITGAGASKVWLSASGFRSLEFLPKPIELTDRQRQVLDMVCAGLSNRVIAEKLGISEVTAKAHIGFLFKALGVSSRTQVVLKAQKLNLVQTQPR